MNLGLYLLRVVKYMLRLVVLLSIVFALMIATGTATGNAEELLNQLFMSDRGTMLMIALFAVSLTYPFFGYTRKLINVDMASHREKIVEIMDRTGYSLYKETDGLMIFRVSSLFRRLTMLGDDSIAIESIDKSIQISGIRKDVVVAGYRLGAIVSE